MESQKKDTQVYTMWTECRSRDVHTLTKSSHIGRDATLDAFYDVDGVPFDITETQFQEAQGETGVYFAGGNGKYSWWQLNVTIVRGDCDTTTVQLM